MNRPGLHPDDVALLEAVADWLICMRARRIADARKAMARVNAFGLLLGWKQRLFGGQSA